MSPKQVIILRRDLKMRRGKEIAQGAHASMKVFFDFLFMEDGNVLTGRITDAMREWKEGIFTKITCYVNSEAELIALKHAADMENIPNAIIQDCGLTEFHNVPTYTALAIGPDYPNKIDPITKHLQLY